VIALNIHAPSYIAAGAIAAGIVVLSTSHRLLAHAELAQAEQVSGTAQSPAPAPVLVPVNGNGPAPSHPAGVILAAIDNSPVAALVTEAAARLAAAGDRVVHAQESATADDVGTDAEDLDAHPDLNTKAAALLHSIARNHALVDGNKRLALAGTIAFFGLNGRRLTLTNDEAYDLVMAVAEGRLDTVDAIAAAPRHRIPPVARRRAPGSVLGHDACEQRAQRLDGAACRGGSRHAGRPHELRTGLDVSLRKLRGGSGCLSGTGCDRRR
jgi:death-on-curing protein